MKNRDFKPILPRSFFYLYLFLHFCQTAFSQSAMEGTVMASDTKKPLPAVSVYLNNTSIGTITNSKGIFILRNIPSEKFKLIASSIGYETYAEMIDPKKISGDIVITLNPKPEQLDKVVLVPDDPNGWKKWGKLFTDLFIGTNSNSNQCHIENPEVIRLRMNPDNTLTAFAREPLVIMNYALGYEIKYKLEEFEFDFNTKVVSYNGYAFFKDLGLSNKKKEMKYEQERKETYLGSLLHFMRTYFINKLDTQGFEMRNLGNISNPEKDRAKYRFWLEWSLHKDSVILDTVDTMSSVVVAPRLSRIAFRKGSKKTVKSAHWIQPIISEKNYLSRIRYQSPGCFGRQYWFC